MRAEHGSPRYPRHDSTGRPRPTHEKPTHISTGVPGLDFPWRARIPSRQERDLGSLEVGKQANVVVLSEDVLTCDEVLIPEIRPVLTLVGGEIVYQAS